MKSSRALSLFTLVGMLLFSGVFALHASFARAADLEYTDENLGLDDEDSSSTQQAHAPRISSDESSAAAVCRMINETRAQYGLEPVRVDSRLNVAAQMWADEMTRRQVGTHIFHQEPGWQERVNSQMNGAAFLMSENIAMNPAGASAVMGMWRSDAPHLKNMLMKGARRVGVGHSGPYWVTDFSN